MEDFGVPSIVVQPLESDDEATDFDLFAMIVIVIERQRSVENQLAFRAA